MKKKFQIRYLTIEERIEREKQEKQEKKKE